MSDPCDHLIDLRDQLERLVVKNAELEAENLQWVRENEIHQARIADLEKGLRLVWYGPDDMNLEECGAFIEGLLGEDT